MLLIDTNRKRKLLLQRLLCVPDRLEPRQDLQRREDLENLSNPLDRDLLDLPGLETQPSVIKNKNGAQHTVHTFRFASYPFSKKAVFALWAIRSWKSLRNTQKKLVRQVLDNICIHSLPNEVNSHQDQHHHEVL